MAKDEAIKYAINQIPQILPLEEKDVRELVNQVLTQNGEHNSEGIAQSFLDILGHDDMSFEFVFMFNEKLNSVPVLTRDPNPKIEPVQESATLKNPQKVRNNVKEDKSHVPVNKGSKKPITAGTLVSSKLNNSKQPKKLKKKDSKSKKVQSLQEIDDVLKILEVEHSEKDSARYVCNCEGNRHPLFEVAPNCLSCGKIICIREGLHLNNCTFCGEELIPIEERMKIIQVLNREKATLQDTKTEENKPKEMKKTKTYKIQSGGGTNLFSEQDKLFDRVEKEKEREKEVEKVQRGKEAQEQQERIECAKKEKEMKNPELAAAQERLDTLLHFQDTSAERTKIIDHASDFSMTNDSSIWGGAYDRALMLKKQQRNLRKWEKLERERHGRRDKVVLDLNIGKDGKVYMREVSKPQQNVHARSDDELDDVSDEEDLQDLKEIRALKEEISLEKNRKSSLLETKIWDYEKDKKQFERPVYIDDKTQSNTNEETEKRSKTSIQQQNSRVQVSSNQENSVEQNILAVL